MIRKYLLPYFAWFFYALLSWTWRKKIFIHPEAQNAIDNNQPLILAHWHGDELAVLHLVKIFKIATMTSTSKDGELINFLICKMGGATSRGSSTRGGVSALKGLIKLVRSGRIASLAVDGPKGPIYKVKPGVFELSRLTQAAIVPVGVSVKNPYIFKKSWNKAILPLPFQKVVMTFGQPREAISKESPTKDLSLAKELEQRLVSAKENATKLIAANVHR